MGRTVFSGGTVVTLNARDDIFPDGVVACQAGRIEYVGPASGFTLLPGDEVIDASDLLVLPGLVNVHTHTAMTYQRGLIEDLPSRQWFARTAALEAQMSEDDLYWSALLGCYEMIRSGVTCIADRFSHMDVIGEAIDASGLRAILGPSLYDIDRRASLPDAVALVKRWGTSPATRISCGLAPVGPDTSSRDLLEDVRAAATELGAKIFIHVGQSHDELKAIRGRGVDGSITYLHGLGFLGPDVVAAHCIYISAAEAAIIAQTETKVAHCPSSNAKIEARVAPIAALLAHGAEIGLGTDSAACNNTLDFFAEMKIAALLNKVAVGQPTAFPIQQILRLATQGGARVMGLEAQVGSLEPGKCADIITVDRRELHLQPPHEIYAHLVYGVGGADVRDVFVDGRRLLGAGAFVGADVDEVRRRAASRPRFN